MLRIWKRYIVIIQQVYYFYLIIAMSSIQLPRIIIIDSYLENGQFPFPIPILINLFVVKNFVSKPQLFLRFIFFISERFVKCLLLYFPLGACVIHQLRGDILKKTHGLKKGVKASQKQCRYKTTICHFRRKSRRNASGVFTSSFLVIITKKSCAQLAKDYPLSIYVIKHSTLKLYQRSSLVDRNQD